MTYLRAVIRAVVVFRIASCGSARPTNLQEEEKGVKKNMNSAATFEINPVAERDQTTIQVAGLGLGRTGSTSLVVALEMLGYLVVHDDEQTETTDLYQANEEDEIDLDEMNSILGQRGFNATFKTASYDWVARHPEIQAILTVRDRPEDYVESWLVAAPFVRLLERAPYRWMPTVQVLMPDFEEEYRGETTDGDPTNYLDRDTLRATYVTYNDKARAAVPAGRLLVFNVKEGWGPLCAYLGRPVPAGIPFPHVHTRAKLQGEMYFLELVTWIWPLAILLPLACLHLLAAGGRRGGAAP